MNDSLFLPIIHSYPEPIQSFLLEILQTKITRCYKLIVIAAFCQQSTIQPTITKNQTLSTWKAFFSADKNFIDLKPTSQENFSWKDYLTITDKEHLHHIKYYPVNYLNQSTQFFHKATATEYFMRLDASLIPFLDNAPLCGLVRAILCERLKNYYQRHHHIEVCLDFLFPTA